MMPSEKEKIEAFKKSLNEKERVVHELAAAMLKTRYDPKRLTIYKEWLKTKGGS